MNEPREKIAVPFCGFTEVLRIYAAQGQDVADKHLEVIVRQMFSRVQIEDAGDSDFVTGDIVSKAAVVNKLDTNFTDQVDTIIYVDKEEKENIKAALVEFFNGKVTLTVQGLREIEVPVNLV